MLPLAEIERYGGKGAILNHLAHRSDLLIPPYLMFCSGFDLDIMLPEINKMLRHGSKRLIVRSSSPYEYSDFEGIFDSVKYVSSVGELEDAIRTVEASATSDKAKLYAELNGFEIDEKMHCIIQQQADSTYRGAMFRHPNNHDLIYIFCADPNTPSGDYKGCSFDEVTGSKKHTYSFMDHGISNDNAKKLIEMYKELEEFENISDDQVLFMEFGMAPFAFFQARPFLKKETADFEIPETDFVRKSFKISSDFCFGITPPEGIAYPVVRGLSYFDTFAIPEYQERFAFSNNELGWSMDLKNLRMNWSVLSDHEKYNAVRYAIREHHQHMDAMADGDYTLVLNSAKNRPVDIDLYAPRMKAFVVGDSPMTLTHESIRLIKRADVTVGLRENIMSDNFFVYMKSLEDKYRIISNGKAAVVMRE